MDSWLETELLNYANLYVYLLILFICSVIEYACLDVDFIYLVKVVCTEEMDLNLAFCCENVYVIVIFIFLYAANELFEHDLP